MEERTRRGSQEISLEAGDGERAVRTGQRTALGQRQTRPCIKTRMSSIFPNALRGCYCTTYPCALSHPAPLLVTVCAGRSHSTSQSSHCCLSHRPQILPSSRAGNYLGSGHPLPTTSDASSIEDSSNCPVRTQRGRRQGEWRRKAAGSAPPSLSSGRE